MSNAECRIKKFLSDLKHLDIHHSAFDTLHFTKGISDTTTWSTCQGLDTLTGLPVAFVAFPHCFAARVVRPNWLK